MKKYLVLVVCMMFVLGIAGSAFAIHASIPAETTGVVAAKDVQIQIEGEIRVRGWYQDNITNGGGTENRRTGLPYDGSSTAWYDQRVRLALDAKIGDKVSGRIHLENFSGYSDDNYLWGEANTIGTPGLGGLKRTTDLRFLEAWIAYTGSGLLGVPAGIKIGHMPVLIGAGTFFDHRRYGDDALLLWVEPAKGTEINLLTAKLFEGAGVGNTTPANPGTNDNTDDLDLYSLMLTHKVGKDHTLGANLSLITSSDLDGTAVVPATFGAALYRLPGTEANYANATLNLYNLGISARGKAAGVGYKATADMQFGKVKDITGLLMTEQKFRGYGVTLGADYKLDPVTLRANFVYGSGDSDASNTAANTKNKAFQTFVGNVIDPNLPTVVYGWRVDTAAGAGIRGTGIANTTAYNLGVTYSPIKDLTLALDGYLLRASKRIDPDANDFGYSKKIGTEVDLKVTYRIARNLTYSINSGVLFAGDFYEDEVGTPLNDPRRDAKNAVVLQHQIVLSF